MMGSLYIHLPFCVRKCPYCDFLSVPFDEGLIRRYTAALGKEMALRGGWRLRTVYIGGGTPTVLPVGEMEAVFSALRENFEVLPGAEVTVEANPGTLGGEKADLLASLGVNRLSLGVQSLSEVELKSLGRAHTALEAVEAVEAAREAGIENLAMDIIYGIPGQGLESWEETLTRAVALGPRHISAYELTPEPGTPLMEALEAGLLNMPDEEVLLGLAERAIGVLAGAGYGRYEISNYALPGSECRHNINYWRRGPYLGLGAGAHSFTGRSRQENTSDIEAYITLLSEGVLPVAGTREITREEALRETVFLGLRLMEGLDPAGFGDGRRPGLMEAAGGLIKEGFMEAAGGRLRLTRQGIVLFNPVVIRLMEALGL